METIDRRTILEATPGLLALFFLAVSGGIDPDGIGAWVRGERPSPPPAARARPRAPLPAIRVDSARDSAPAARPASAPVSEGLLAREVSTGEIRITASSGSSGRVEINRATKQDLERLPGIGSVRASAILAARASRGGRFASWEELEMVPGIGPKTLERIRREASL